MMIKIAQNKKCKNENSTIALINIVFLMLIFFLIAGTVVPPINQKITPVLSDQPDDTELENILTIGSNGQLFAQGKPTTAQHFMDYLKIKRDAEPLKAPIRILPDKNLKATILIATINRLQDLGATAIHIVSERKAR